MSPDLDKAWCRSLAVRHSSSTIDRLQKPIPKETQSKEIKSFIRPFVENEKLTHFYSTRSEAKFEFLYTA